MTVGTHGTTYGGNPLAGAVAGELLSIVNTPEVLSGVRQRHQWFCERLQAINARYGLFKEIRGLGLLLGCVLNDAWAGQGETSVTWRRKRGDDSDRRRQRGAFRAGAERQ